MIPLGSSSEGKTIIERELDGNSDLIPRSSQIRSFYQAAGLRFILLNGFHQPVHTSS